MDRMFKRCFDDGKYKQVKRIKFLHSPNNIIIQQGLYTDLYICRQISGKAVVFNSLTKEVSNVG